MTGALCGKIGYDFSNRALLETALTHASAQKKSARKTAGNAKDNNERLEFLGDRVLGLAIADLLIAAFPGEAEGSLAKRHTSLVQQQALVRVAREIGLAEHLKLSTGEMKSGGQKKDKILADAMEALIGALYLDAGLAPARDFVRRAWDAAMAGMTAPPKDAKTALQEFVLARGFALPRYELVSRDGPPHDPVFVIAVAAGGGRGEGRAGSKRAAERMAAADLLAHLAP